MTRQQPATDLWAVWMTPGPRQPAHIMLPGRRALCGVTLGPGPLHSVPEQQQRCPSCAAIRDDEAVQR